MKNYNYSQSKMSLIFVLLLLTLLPTLALLQYRWLGQVSVAERERMQASLKSSANNFTKDFDREITRIFFGLNSLNRNIQHKEENTNLEQNYIEAYQKWLANTKHPELIKALYLVDNQQLIQGKELLKFSPGTDFFQSSDWPKELSNLKEKLQQNFSINDSEDKKHFNFQSETPVISDIPAIIVSSFNPLSLPKIDLSNPNPDVLLNLKVSSKYLIVLLDISYIKDRLLPSLAREYFTSNNQVDYNIAVVNVNQQNSFIYQSSQEINEDFLKQSDIKLNFFSINLEELDRFVFVNTLSSETKPISAIVDNTIVERRSETKPEEAKPQKDENKTQKTTKATISIVQSTKFSSTLGSSPRVKMLSFERNKQETSSPWQLVVKHRSGSLDSAVNNLRQRNLAVSFGILLLLAFSMGMILVSTQRAQSLAKQQMEFVAGVSHELRTPLAVICSAGENLADGVVNKPEQIKRYGSLIKGEGRRLGDMVEQILEFAGWQSHKKTYQIQPTSVANIVENAISACSTLISETNTEVVIDIDLTVPLVEADPAALQRAVQNLIANGIKYSGDIKWLKIVAKFQAKFSQVEISITDRGIGIHAKEIPYIFEPFYRGQEAIDAQIHGSGLGLSLVRQIVSACGGKVTVTSIVNQGSTFTLHLPLTKAKQMELAKEIYE